MSVSVGGSSTDLPFVARKTDDYNTLTKIKDRWSIFLSRGEKSLQGRIQYAITGKVEQNQHEALGVYLDKIQSAEPRYYTDEDVVIWGNVKARTLDDPINIEIGCYVKKDNKKIYAEKTDPDIKFSVFTFEEQDFSCTFTKKQIEEKSLEVGSNTITTFSYFNI